MIFQKRRRGQFDLTEKDLEFLPPRLRCWINTEHFVNRLEHASFANRKFSKKAFSRIGALDIEQQYEPCSDLLSSSGRDDWDNNVASSLSYF